jgi:NAD(P)-dependent dehydrogenase (short-subunit alcohol dehydrogenase family)
MTDSTNDPLNNARLNRLAGKRAVVVGAGQLASDFFGMGRATAFLFAREGARVFIVDRDADRVEETAELMRAEGHEPITCAADITIADDCERLVETAVKEMGGIDVLQNTVGIYGNGDVVEISEAEWDKVMDTNVKGMWATSTHALKAMRDQRWGSVINYSSLGGIYGRSNGVYGISKAAVNQLTATLAIFNAPYRLRINAIMPGLIATAMAYEGRAVTLWGQDSLSPEERDAITADRLTKMPMGYAGDAFDCARLGLFLASDESRYISGACIPVDGAYSVGSFYTNAGLGRSG